MQSSQVPHVSLNPSHATYTPDTAWPVSRLPPRLSWEPLPIPVLMSSLEFSMRLQWFTFARLSYSYMTCLSRLLTVTFTTSSVSVRSSLRLFKACSCKPALEGLPPSHVQHGTQLRAPSWHKQWPLSNSDCGVICNPPRTGKMAGLAA